jgi:hypothetical protein
VALIQLHGYHETLGDKVKTKEDTLKTPTKARVLDQQATPLNQQGTASQAVLQGGVRIVIKELGSIFFLTGSRLNQPANIIRHIFNLGNDDII